MKQLLILSIYICLFQTAHAGLKYDHDFDIDQMHPQELTYDKQRGQLKSIEVTSGNIVRVCGKAFYKSPTTGNIFLAKQTGKTWAAAPAGQYTQYVQNAGGFQRLLYKKGRILSVGQGVNISHMREFIAANNWTGISFQDNPEHKRCLLIIDEEMKDVFRVNLGTEEKKSVFN